MVRWAFDFGLCSDDPYAAQDAPNGRPPGSLLYHRLRGTVRISLAFRNGGGARELFCSD